MPTERPRQWSRRIALAVGAVLLAGLAGCGTRTSVSGQVTYEGTAIEDGTITLQPADGKGTAASGKITAGKYELANVTPGPKVVNVVATRKVPFARSSEEMAQKFAEAKARGNATGLIDPADVVPANAEGNNSPVEVKPGSQVLDFHLKKPRGR